MITYGHSTKAALLLPPDRDCGHTMNSKHRLSLLSMFLIMTCCRIVLGIMVLVGAEVSRAILYIALAWFYAVCGVPSVSLLLIVGSLRFGSTMLSAEARWWQRLAAGAGSLTLL